MKGGYVGDCWCSSLVKFGVGEQSDRIDAWLLQRAQVRVRQGSVLRQHLGGPGVAMKPMRPRESRTIEVRGVQRGPYLVTGPALTFPEFAEKGTAPWRLAPTRAEPFMPGSRWCMRRYRLFRDRLDAVERRRHGRAHHRRPWARVEPRPGASCSSPKRTISSVRHTLTSFVLRQSC